MLKMFYYTIIFQILLVFIENDYLCLQLSILKNLHKANIVSELKDFFSRSIILKIQSTKERQFSKISLT